MPHTWVVPGLIPLLAGILLVASPADGGWTILRAADGLAGDTVRGVVEDQNENLWFATTRGVSRYDGITWRTYTRNEGLPADNAYCAFAARDGSVWFGFYEGGIAHFDHDQLQTVTPPSNLTRYTVWSISQDETGTLWFATLGGGAYSFDGTTWTWLAGLPTNSVEFVFLDHAGDLWVGTNGIGLLHRAGGTWQPRITTPTIAGNRVRHIIEDENDNLWLATDGGVSRRDPSGVWQKYTTAEGLSSNNVLAVFQDRSGMFWFATFNEGVCRFDGRSWRTFSSLDGYFFWNSAYSVMQDRSGNLWFGTSGGAARFDDVNMTTFPEVPGLGSDISYAVVEDRDGGIWVGTDKSGVFQFNGNEWTNLTTADGLAGNTVVGILQDHAGNFWFPSQGGGVSRWDGDTTWVTFTSGDGLASDLVRWVIEDDDQNIWLAHVGGVSRFDGSAWVTFTEANTKGGLASDNVYAMLRDSAGSMWFGSFNAGVSRLDTAGGWRNFTSASGLGGDFITSMFQDRDGYLWFATPGGGATRALGEPSPGGSEMFTTASGLRNNSVLSFMQTRDGNMWFALDQGGGAMQWDGTEWRALDGDDGIPSGSVHLMLEDRNGDLWFTTNHGVARYTRDRVPPRTVITVRPPSVSASRNQSALFSALGESNRIEYSFRLDGGGWSEWSSLGGWTGQDLPDGSHVLEVQSRDYWVNVDATPETVTFEIDGTPPQPVVTAPVFGSPVADLVEITGTAADERFLRYELLVRAAGSKTWEPPEAITIAVSSTPVASGLLTSWDTSALADGFYDLQLSVTDVLGLTGRAQLTVVVDNEAPFFDKTSPAKITAASGGDIYTTDAELHLYVPPRGFLEDVVVTVTTLSGEHAPPNLPGGIVPLGPGYDLDWGANPLQKPAILDLSLAGFGVATSEGTPVVYRLIEGTGWNRMGGTVDQDKERISLAIQDPGPYAMYLESGTPTGTDGLSVLSFTPRVFSPSGTFGRQEVGIGFTLGRPGEVTVKVFDLSGRLVREVAAGQSMAGGANLVTWDGRDREGDIALDGLYVVTVEALGKVQKRTLAVVR